MRIIHIHRILGLAAALAGIGSFAIGLATLPFGNGASIDAPGVPQAVCDWAVYEPVIRKLRAEPKPAEIDRFALLGADPYFTYYYDYATGRVACVVQPKPKGPLVEASRSEGPDPTRRAVILVCVLVMVLCGTGLQILRMSRTAQAED